VSTEQQVTAYLPCYNVARYLAATIEGLLRQTHAPAEILIVDDGCTDDTIAVARRYPVRVVSHEVNRGLAAARNTALQAARTPLVASLDTDAVPEPDWLERLLPHFTDPRVAGVSGRMLHYRERHRDRGPVFSLLYYTGLKHLLRLAYDHAPYGMKQPATYLKFVVACSLERLYLLCLLPRFSRRHRQTGPAE
jgi:glycosyltransferase involved in cell wall biosynthesis